MPLLLDTAAFVRWSLDEPIPEAAASAIEQADDVALSVVTMWELAVKVSVGKIELDLEDVLLVAREGGLPVLDVTLLDASSVAALPLLHRDPFDRMLVAQAKRRQRTLVTPDGLLARYGVDVLWS